MHICRTRASNCWSNWNAARLDLTYMLEPVCARNLEGSVGQARRGSGQSDERSNKGRQRQEETSRAQALMPHSPAYNRALASGSCPYVYAVELSSLPDSHPWDRQAATALISVALRLSETGIQIQAKEPRSRERQGSPHNLIVHTEKNSNHTRNPFPTRPCPISRLAT